MNRNVLFLALPLVAVLTATAMGQNLLTNGNFEAGGASPCGNGWTKAPGTDNCSYDGSVWPPAGGAYEGSHYGTTDVQGNFKTANIYQVVNVTPALEVRLTGVISGFAGTPGTATRNHFIRVYNGPDTTTNPTPIAKFEMKPGIATWQAFDLKGTPTLGQVTVSWGFDQPGPEYVYVATHVDALVLTQTPPECTGEPAVTSISPSYGANGGTLTGVQVTGTDFDSTCQVILRRDGYTDVQAINEVTSGGGTIITCDLPLASVAMGKWNIVVTKTYCNEAVLNNALIVASATLANGSFELPAGHPDSCPNPTPSAIPPTSWLQAGIASGSNYLGRDSDQFVPSCPRPDGTHYASVTIPADTFMQDWRVYQYVAVTPGQQITVSGKFAGGGRSTVKLQLLEGDDLDDGNEILGSTTIEDREGCPPHQYDWVPASVTGTPTGGLVTVRWLVSRQRDHVTASHADALTLALGAPPAEICDNGLDDDGDRRTDCQDPDCAAAPGCDPAPVEICGNGLDDDGDLRIDCDDSDCDSVCVEICHNGIDDDQNCAVDDGCEICDNGVDDNGDDLVDCADPTCAGIPPCPSEICTNGIDDDGNTLVDCADPSCANDPHCKANDPFADADGDGDVDQADFAAMQLCFTGTGGSLQIGCGMFDQDHDLDVDQADMVAFEACAKGPGVAADADCDD